MGLIKLYLCWGNFCQEGNIAKNVLNYSHTKIYMFIENIFLVLNFIECDSIVLITKVRLFNPTYLYDLDGNQRGYIFFINFFFFFHNCREKVPSLPNGITDPMVAINREMPPVTHMFPTAGPAPYILQASAQPSQHPLYSHPVYMYPVPNQAQLIATRSSSPSSEYSSPSHSPLLRKKGLMNMCESSSDENDKGLFIMKFLVHLSRRLE